MAIMLTNCSFEGAFRDGIHIEGSPDITFENVVSRNNGRDNFHLAGGTPPLEPKKSPQMALAGKRAVDLAIGVSTAGIAKYLGWT